MLSSSGPSSPPADLFGSNSVSDFLLGSASTSPQDGGMLGDDRKVSKLCPVFTEHSKISGDLALSSLVSESSPLVCLVHRSYVLLVSEK